MSEDSTGKRKDPGELEAPAEGWEALGETEPSGGTLAASDELEAALREASAAAEQRSRKGGGEGQGGSALDKATIEALSSELQELKPLYEQDHAELEALRDKHLRLQAEFENFRRRGLKDRQEAHSYGHQNLVKDLLATVDNLDRAIEHTEQSGEGGGDLDALLQGVELVRRELLSALAKHGVNEIEAEGKPFDPAVHEAMAQQPSGEVEPNAVLHVLQKGYLLRDRMLRPARVVVAGAPPEAPGQNQAQAEEGRAEGKAAPDGTERSE